MKNYNMENLSFLRGRDLKLTDDIFVIHPKLGEIEEIGYKKYSEYLSTIISTSLDVADQLWFEMEVWYEDIKDEWSFFIQKSLSEMDKKTIDVKIMDSLGRLSRVEKDCIAIGDTYRDALNYFLNLNGEYIVLEKTTDQIKQMIIYNVNIDTYGDYYIDGDSFKFTKFFYEITTEFLKDCNWIKPSYDFIKGGNKNAKKYILKNTYKNRKKKNNNIQNITLDSIVSSLICKSQNSNNIWEYPIYLIYNQYYRLIKLDEYQNTMNALNNGCIDTKKNPINWEKINWSSVIN